MQWLKGFYPIAVSLCIGLLGAIFFLFIYSPLPWLLSSIVGLRVASRFNTIPLKSPKRFSAPVRALLGMSVLPLFIPSIRKKEAR